MTDARKKPSSAFLGTEFNDFLFASIGMDRIGGQLSVVSALARLNMDPWDEAKKLSQLPSDSAAQKLTLCMLRLPELVSGYDDRTNTAKRLVALLPGQAGGTAGSGMRDVAGGGSATTKGMIAAFCLLTLALLVAGQIVWGSQSSLHSSSAHASSPVALTAQPHNGPGS